MTAQDSLDNVKDAVKESIIYHLKDLKENDSINVSDEISDWVFEAVDNEISGLDRMEQMEIIDDFGGEDTIDKGLVDNSSLDRTIATTAWAVLEQELYSDNEMNELFKTLYSSVEYEEAQELIEELT